MRRFGLGHDADRSALRPGNPGKVLIIRRPAMSPLQFGMHGNFAPGVQHPHRARSDGHPHPFADQPPRHRVGVAVHLDRTIGADPAQQLARRHERRNASRRTQRRGLVAFKPLARRLARRPVHPCIGNLAGPGLEMRFHRRPCRKAPPGNRVPLDVTDTALVLALGARAIRCAGADTETPMPGKRVQPRVQHHLATDRVMMQDQRLGVVEQNLPRHAAEGAKRKRGKTLGTQVQQSSAPCDRIADFRHCCVRANRTDSLSD